MDHNATAGTWLCVLSRLNRPQSAWSLPLVRVAQDLAHLAILRVRVAQEWINPAMSDRSRRPVR
jgi:hypothetical protein